MKRQYQVCKIELDYELAKDHIEELDELLDHMPHIQPGDLLKVHYSFNINDFEQLKVFEKNMSIIQNLIRHGATPTQFNYPEMEELINTLNRIVLKIDEVSESFKGKFTHGD